MTDTTEQAANQVALMGSTPQHALIVGESGDRATDIALLLNDHAIRRSGGRVARDEVPALTPRTAKLRLRDRTADTVVVFTDQAVMTRTPHGTQMLPAGEMPVIYAESAAPFFVRALLRGEIRPEDHRFWRAVQRKSDVRQATVKLIRATAPAAERDQLLSRLERNRLDAGTLGTLLAGALGDSPAIYESKRAFCATVVRVGA